MKKEKEKKKGKGKVVGGVGVLAVAAVLVFLFGKGFGLGSGDGSGKDGNGEKSQAENTVDDVKDVAEENNEQTSAVTVTIEVKQGQYFVDGAEKTLADVEALLTGEDVANTSFVLEDNYASTKAWDEIKNLFTQYEIDVVEQ